VVLLGVALHAIVAMNDTPETLAGLPSLPMLSGLAASIARRGWAYWLMFSCHHAVRADGMRCIGKH